ADATFIVEETIRLHTDNETIKHGIQRSIPSLYFDAQGDGYRYWITPLAATRDGHAEPWRDEYRNATVITVGNPNALLPAGEHTFTLRYRVEDELGFFPNHDELNWNVTGDRWAYPIDHASVDFSLPGTIDPAEIHTTGATGAAGDHGRDFRG